nr:malonyl CoA ACP transacylase [Actinoallomurus sp.]
MHMSISHSVSAGPQGGVALLFAGQGGQYPGMSHELYHAEPIFREELERLDAMVTGLGGPRVVPALHRREGPLDDVLVSHPAIFMVQYALARTLIRHGIFPAYCLGMSTGEFAAVAVAGGMDAGDALYCVIEQAGALEHACGNGGMLAVVRPPRFYRGTPEINQRCSLALAGKAHFVIAGECEDVQDSLEWLELQGVTKQRLPVRVGFHSAAIDPGRDRYLHAVEGVPTSRPSSVILSCVTGGPLTARPDARHFWDAIREPMKVEQAITSLTRRFRPGAFVDVGPGGVFATFLRQAGARPFHSLLTPAGQELKRLRTCVASVVGNGRHTPDDN